MDIEWTDWQTSDSGKGSADREPCEITCVDSRLAHLIQAKKSMQQRLSKQKYNKKLRRRITELDKEIETQCNRICEQKWEEVCNTMDGNINTGKTWKLLKHLLHPTSTRTAVRTEMTKLKHKHRDNMQAFGDEIIRVHLTRPPGEEHSGTGFRKQ
ncbi:hypothetical protein HPB50_019623 [Hyalomma asiaticum]|uniref:Uncharacterized protein n=1 Tax=Hyalomma asiaticum TaxID=266040 RepID=A0ACB7RQD1_HYAAI|nr:hypothetical protein HPB50_019623 [Hyalomma asiaticum]